MNIFEKSHDIINQMMKEGEESLIEFIQSDIHICEQNIDDRIIFFVTSEGYLKYNLNIQSIFMMQKSVKIKCCMFCGFTAEK